MKRIYFGTDGIRGEFGGPVINPEFAARLGAAVGRWLRAQAQVSGGVVLIGRDTRASGVVLMEALAAGLATAGWTAVDLGVLPTPAVSRAVKADGAAFGVMITASHNPAEDNGIKFFNGTGVKLTDVQESEIEQLLSAEPVAVVAGPLPVGEALKSYAMAANALLPAGALRGWKIVLDTANGATCGSSPWVLQELGAEVEAETVEARAWALAASIRRRWRHAWWRRAPGSGSPTTGMATVVRCATKTAGCSTVMRFSRSLRPTGSPTGGW